MAGALLAVPGARAAKKAAAGQYFVYVGCYTSRGQSQGIQLFRFDSATGKLTADGLAGEAVNPSYVNLHPSGKYLYSVSEVSSLSGQRSGGVSAFSIDRTTGRLSKLNSVLSRGTGPCFVRTDATGKMALVANYGSGSVAALPIKADGSLGEAVGFDQHRGSGANKARQEGPHAHSANFSPDNRFAIVADLGTDRLYVYKIDPATAGLSPHDPPFFQTAPGAGPRHFAFHPNGKWAYVINEIDCTLAAMTWDRGRGVLAGLQTVSTLPAGVRDPGYSTAEVVVHPSGEFLYGSNRGHDTLALFTIGKDGRLTPAGHTPTQGKVPRNFNLDPTGKWLIVANQESGNLVVFAIAAKSGKLTPTGQIVPAGAPVCVKFLPLG